MSLHSPAPSDRSSGAPQRAVLAIDYGRRRLGLALSDLLGITARPLATWERTNRRGDLTRIRDLCRRHAVGRIVVGWPIRLDGTPGEMAREAARFAERLRKYLGLPVELADERLSSWEAAQQVQVTGGRAGRRAGKPLDDVAAAIILRDYLSRARRAEQTRTGRAEQTRAVSAERI
ncbi:MAG TPA: Holliday junction resolvase RuvX [Candidatus Acidoferrales bacterium]